MNQRRPLPGLPWVANVHNAIDVSRYQVDRNPGDSLLFLGRMSPDKGAHRAIRIAKRLGRPLDIAAKCREPAEIAYFDEFVAPHLDDDIRYVGEVDHDEKCELLARAHALVVPIEWEEPFGLVMIEALASGTPVVAMRRGSVPEILRHGETAMIADDLAGMVAMVDQVAEPRPRPAQARGRDAVLGRADGRGLPRRVRDDDPGRARARSLRRRLTHAFAVNREARFRAGRRSGDGAGAWPCT